MDLIRLMNGDRAERRWKEVMISGVIISNLLRFKLLCTHSLLASPGALVFKPTADLLGVQIQRLGDL